MMESGCAFLTKTEAKREGNSVLDLTYVSVGVEQKKEGLGMAIGLKQVEHLNTEMQCINYRSWL